MKNSKKLTYFGFSVFAVLPTQKPILQGFGLSSGRIP